MEAMKRDRIVFFIATLTNGGAERVISILSKWLACAGKNVEIVLYFDSAPFYEIHPDVNITYVERETGSRKLHKNLIWLRRYFSKNADVVISFLAKFNMIALLALWGTGIPVLVADRNDPRQIPKQAPLRLARDILYHLADSVVVQTQHNKSYFSNALQKKCRIIYNPVDLQEKKGMALRTEKKKRVVSVARLMKQKNQLMLIDSFAKIGEEFLEHTLTIYGEGPYREVLENRIRELGLESRVFLPGKTQNVFDSIADAELFVLSSDFEGMPNALIEAMCLGLPVISTRVSGATELIQDGKNGLLTDVDSGAQLTAAMRRMLENPELRKNCAREAVRLNDLLNTDHIVEQWLELVNELITEEKI